MLWSVVESLPVYNANAATACARPRLTWTHGEYLTSCFFHVVIGGWPLADVPFVLASTQKVVPTERQQEVPVDFSEYCACFSTNAFCENISS